MSDQILEDNKIDNGLRTFWMYDVLEKPLVDFINQGDGVYALPVFEEVNFPDAELVDISLINLIKLLSTGFGHSNLGLAFKIADRIRHDADSAGFKVTRRNFRFRSRHPLFIDGRKHYQNVCLISGMVHFGISIFPYFDGKNFIEQDDNPDHYLKRLRLESPDLF